MLYNTLLRGAQLLGPFFSFNVKVFVTELRFPSSTNILRQYQDLLICGKIFTCRLLGNMHARYRACERDYVALRPSLKVTFLPLRIK